MLKIVLYEMQTGRHSPGQWAKDTRDRRCLLWLGHGIKPSRSRWYTFRGEAHFAGLGCHFSRR
jgi:hypothetical protein